jgi:ERCC4-type nuclease
MKVIIDEREHALIALFTPDQIQHQVLPIGDIIITQDDGDADSPVLIFERKTIADLLSSIQDGRYKEQSQRLALSSGLPAHRIVYIIEGTIQPSDRPLVNATMVSLAHYKGFTVHRTTGVEDTKNLILDTAQKLERNRALGKTLYVAGAEGAGAGAAVQPTMKKVKRDNVTKENIGEFMLAQIPAVSPATAAAILKVYPTVLRLVAALKENPNCLDEVTLEGGKRRRINKTAIEGIKEFLLQE